MTVPSIKKLRVQTFGNYASLDRILNGLKAKITVYAYSEIPINRIPLLDDSIFGCGILENGIAIIFIKDKISYSNYSKLICHPVFDFGDRFKLAVPCGELKLYNDLDIKESVQVFNCEFDNMDKRIVFICNKDGSNEITIGEG